jgi:hypothetical protein
MGGSSGLTTAVYVAVAWLLINWWPHDNLNRVTSGDWNRLAMVEYGFHLPLMLAARRYSPGSLSAGFAWSQSGREIEYTVGSNIWSVPAARHDDPRRSSGLVGSRVQGLDKRPQSVQLKHNLPAQPVLQHSLRQPERPA